RYILVARMQRNETLRRKDRLVILVDLVVRVGAHQHGSPRPLRIGMLALHLVKLLDGGNVLPLLHMIHRLVVDLLYRALFIGNFVIGRAARQPGNSQCHDTDSKKAGANGAETTGGQPGLTHAGKVHLILDFRPRGGSRNSSKLPTRPARSRSGTFSISIKAGRP